MILQSNPDFVEDDFVLRTLMFWIGREIFEKACDWSQILTGEMSISEIRGFISGSISSLINRRTDTGWDMESGEMVGRALAVSLGYLELIRGLFLDRRMRQMQSSAREELKQG